MSRKKKVGPSTMELKLRSDLERARRDLNRLKRDGEGAAPAESADVGSLRGQIDELEQTKERLSKLYFQQLDENRKRAGKLHEILRVISLISAHLDLDTVLERIASTIQTSLGFRIVFIRLRDAGSDRLRAAAFAGLPESACQALGAQDIELSEFQGWLREEFRVSRSYFISHKHQFSRRLPSGHVPDLGQREEWEWHAEDVLLVPLVSGSGELLAYISVDDPVDRLVPSQEVIELLEVFASHAVVAIENARLYRQLARRTQELEEASRHMKEMHALKANFVSTISHELRTPLTAIRAYVDMLQATGNDQLSGDEFRQFLAVLNEESLRLSRLIESVLDLSSLDSRQLQSKRQDVDLAEVVDETVWLLRRMAQAGHVDLKVTEETADTRLDADRDQMRQLVIHLGGNAVKFTPAGGRVVLRLSGDEQSVTLQVEDTGIGIPEEALEKIFDRFYQVDSSLVRRYGGTGLGLAICKSIVEGHQGTVAAKSAPGEGSVFTVTLPRRIGPRVIVRPDPDLGAPTEDVLRLATQMVSEVMGAGVVSLMRQEDDGTLTIQAAIGLDEQVVRETRVQPGAGVSGWVAHHRRPVCVARGTESDEVSGRARTYRTGTYLSVPIEGPRGLFGVLNVTDPISRRHFRPEDCNLLLDLAERIGGALQQAQSLEESQNGLGGTTDALRRVLEHLRSGRKNAPDRAVLAQAIAREIGLDDAQVGVLGFAATVHDVGMTMVSRGILEQRGPLSDQQRAEMQRHVELGVEVLRPLEAMGAVREVVLSHHEWWDGSGYPRGLSGEEIPVGARVLAVVDAFESMTQGRAHRLPKSREAALLEIMELRGKQFDPEAVDALARVLPQLEIDSDAEAVRPREFMTFEEGR